MDFILSKKLKFYTKEILKIVKLSMIAIGFIIAIVLVKYKPIYQVSLLGEEVGFVKNKEAFQETLKNNMENLEGENVNSITLQANPEFEFKLVNKTQETNENEILVAVQKEMKITYQYYEIANGDETIETLATKSEAEKLVQELKQESEDLTLTISEKTTENIEEVSIDSLEVAKSKLNETLVNQDEEKRGIAEVNGIELAMLPIQGTISSRYGVNSRIRVSTHTGLDIAARSGTDIKVMAGGTVTCASYQGSYGNLVKVDHGNNVETWYAHTSKMYVKVGQTVEAGDVIAAVGSTGNSTGPHLHLEIRINGQHVNPQNYVY